MTDFWNSQSITQYFAEKPADPRIVEFLEPGPEVLGVEALDLGCGGGRHSELLAGHGFETLGVDVNPAMIAATRARLAARGLVGRVEEGSITDIPAEDGTFDVVVTTGVLHQARTLGEYEKALHELSRVTKVGANVLLNIFTNPLDDPDFDFVTDDRKTVRTKEGLLMTLLSSTEFISMMHQSGFELTADQGETTRQENTGPRTTFRAFFQKSVPKTALSNSEINV